MKTCTKGRRDDAEIGQYGERIRTSDLTVPNYERGKNVSAFSKVAATKEFRAFSIRSHPLPFVIGCVLRILSTNWPQVLG